MFSWRRDNSTPRQDSEMKTGEGKTLVSTLPAYLNSLTEGVHIVTVNDYLAETLNGWKVFSFWGLAGCITSNLEDEDRRKL